MSNSLDNLTPLEQELLSTLPTEPVGLSLAELAEGLLENTGPQVRGQVKAALEVLRTALGGLHVGRGDDDLGHADVEVYGLRRAVRARVQEFFQKGRV